MNQGMQAYLQALGEEALAELGNYYQVGVSQTMAQAIRAPNVDDAIVAQFLPQVAELSIDQAELDDPIGDYAHMPVKGLIHRYENRVLWRVTPRCAVYCRFCFRKESIGRKGEALSAADRLAGLEYIARHPEIEEVIFSGGDPLMLSNAKLAQFLQALETMAHVRRVRFHTRMPLVEPKRIDAGLCALFERFKKARFLVLHANHAQEFTVDGRQALRRLQSMGVVMWSQSVLLAGVNAEVAVLADLMNTFLDCGVVPYYLHHLDLAKGTGHFRLTLEQGLALEAGLRARLSGVAMPTYVVEIPGGGGKIPVRLLTPLQKQALAKAGIV